MTANNWRWLATHCLLATGLLSSPLGVRAQQAAPQNSQLTHYRQQYPGTAAVILDYRQDLTVEVVRDSVQVVARHHYDLLHLAEQSTGYARDQVYSSHFNRLQSVEAYSLVPDGKSTRKLKVREFRDKFDIRPGVFFDDARQVSFTFPAVAPGVRTVTDYTVRHPDARFVVPFQLGSYLPTCHAELAITLPRAARLSYKLFHVAPGSVTFTRQDKGNTTTYRWVAENLPAAPRDDDAPAGAWHQPHIVYLIEEVPVAGKPRKLLAGVNELYTMYAGFVANTDEPPRPALKRVVDSLVAGATSPDERARKIYHWVQQHVRYIAFENGLRGFVPSTANKVFADRYGDCKDMANLTHQMCQVAGLPSYLAWIGTRDLPYRYEELATPGVNNHMIAAYESAPGKYVFLDATGRYTSFGMPTSMIQGKEALLGIDATHFRVATVPVVPAAENQSVDISTVQLDGNGLKGTGTRTLTGFVRERTAHALDGLDKMRESRQMQQLLERGNNKFSLATYQVGNLTDADKPLQLSYSYHLQDYVQRLDDEIYVNLNLEKPLANDRIDANTRRLPRTNDFASTNHTRTALEIPADYEVASLPPAVAVQDSLASYTIRYERQGNRVVQDCEVTIHYLLLPPTAFAHWNQLIGQLTAAYQQTVVLKRKKA